MQEELDLKAKEKANKKKNKGKGKGKKKKGKEDDFMDDKTIVTQDPSVNLIQEAIKKYKDVWVDVSAEAQKQESANFEQRHNDLLLKKEVKPKVFEELTDVVNELIKIELVDMAASKKKEIGKYPSKKQKKAVKKEKKKAKKKKKKEKKKLKKALKKERKLPGGKQAKLDGKERKIEDMLGYLIEHSICKRLAPAVVSDFIGEEDPLRHILEKQQEEEKERVFPDPSMAQLRQVITLH